MQLGEIRRQSSHFKTQSMASLCTGVESFWSERREEYVEEAEDLSKVQGKASIFLGKLSKFRFLLVFDYSKSKIAKNRGLTQLRTLKSPFMLRKVVALKKTGLLKGWSFGSGF